ncbi:recombinase family protein [Leucobacter coleopterorum]|uniref:recombinase family protein n=1 Tax=Leucobacter coleopterorum TaxID=2714933 RepID=UPI00197D0135|nr:recombinase family protein [Leucobacter coleopterorum]
MTAVVLSQVPVTLPPFRWTGPEAPLPGTRPVFLYLRLSRAHGDGRDAIERQRLDLMRKLATEGGWTVMGEYVDRDSASAYARRERAGWRALNAGIASGRVRAVAFWKLDRTLRIASRCLEWVTSCQQQGVTLLSHQDSTEELNSVTAAAKLSTGVKALLAEAETDTMSERQRAAKRHAAQAGFINGGRRPFGWHPGPRVSDSAGRTGRRLEPHPVEHQALKDAVALVLAGAGLREVAVHWQAKFGITGLDGGLVSEHKVRAALISPRMVGYRQYQLPPHQRGVHVDSLDYIARTPNGEPVISQEPVCDLDTWHRVQSALRSRSTGQRNGWGARAWLLTGLLRCPCGRPLSGVVQPQKPDAGGHRAVRYVYRCKANRRYGVGTCTGGASITAPVAEQYVIDWLFEFFSSDRLNAHNRKVASANVAAVTRVDAELAVAREELESLRSNASPLTVGSEFHQIVTAMMTRVQNSVAKLNDERAALTAECPELLTHEQLVAAWPTLNSESRRTLLRQLIHQIDLAPGRRGPAERLDIVLHAIE